LGAYVLNLLLEEGFHKVVGTDGRACDNHTLFLVRNAQLRSSGSGHIGVAAVHRAFGGHRSEPHRQNFSGEAVEGADRGVSGAHYIDVIEIGNDVRFGVRRSNGAQGPHKGEGK
jgi:hypothetical protein